jgi:hypothetical protein
VHQLPHDGRAQRRALHSNEAAVLGLEVVVPLDVAVEAVLAVGRIVVGEEAPPQAGPEAVENQTFII